MQDCQRRCESGYNKPGTEEEFRTGKTVDTWGCRYIHFNLYTELLNSDG